MKIKRIKKLKVNSFIFAVEWDNKRDGAEFQYPHNEKKALIIIGTKNPCQTYQWMLICHELFEICAIELNVRFRRPDVGDDYLFSFDHRQHETLTNMFAALSTEFVQ